MLDRLSEAKLVRRSYGVVPGDNRGVLVTITPKGRRLIRAIATELGKHLPETKIILKELLALTAS
jgi:DNA-binding MarR family transcriptional regulator